MALGTEVVLGPGYIVLDWDPARLPKNGAEPPPQFPAKTAGCINMPLGMEVGLRTGEFVLDGDPAPSPKRDGAPPPL